MELEQNKKQLQKWLNEWIPMNYGQLKKQYAYMSGKQSAVYGLIELACEGGSIKAINEALDRVLGKVVKPVIVHKTRIRQIYPLATEKLVGPDQDKAIVSKKIEDIGVVIDKGDLPSEILMSAINHIGDLQKDDISLILDNREDNTVAMTMAASLYSMAIINKDLNSIISIFNRLDGAVADVVAVYDDSTITLPIYADKAPYDAKKDDNGVFYVDL